MGENIKGLNQTVNIHYSNLKKVNQETFFWDLLTIVLHSYQQLLIVQDFFVVVKLLLKLWHWLLTTTIITLT